MSTIFDLPRTCITLLLHDTSMTLDSKMATWSGGWWIHSTYHGGLPPATRRTISLKGKQKYKYHVVANITGIDGCTDESALFDTFVTLHRSNHNDQLDKVTEPYKLRRELHRKFPGWQRALVSIIQTHDPRIMYEVALTPTYGGPW